MPRLHPLTLTIAAATLATLAIAGCARTVPLRASLSDSLVAVMKPSQRSDVSRRPSSLLKDGEYPASAPPGTTGEGSGTYEVAIATTFNRIATEFLEAKYPNATADGQPVELILESLSLQVFTTDSTGSRLLVSLGGGETTFTISASVKVRARLGANERVLSASADDAQVEGTGTGTQTSALYQGDSSREARMGRAINAALNKAMALSNAFFDQVQ